MLETQSMELVRRSFLNAHGVRARPGFSDLLHVTRADAPRAVLGYRRAGTGPLFLERYLDAPIETFVSAALGRPVPRGDVIEIGSLAADDAFALVSLWATAANDLGADCEVAVATLTEPLRRMFARIGVPLHVLGRATADRMDDPEAWGRYYESDPMVCAGLIAEGQRAIAAYLASRRKAAA